MIFAANDAMALGALHALRTAGLDVPGRVALAGFDDIPLARYLGLSTVRVDISGMGVDAVARLLDALEGRAASAGTTTVATTLSIRETTR